MARKITPPTQLNVSTVRVQIQHSDGTTEILPGSYAGMDAAWDALLAAQAKYGEANVRPVVADAA